MKQKQKRPVITRSSDIENLYHMRLMSLLQELVRKRGYKGTAEVLEIDPRTVAFSAMSGQLSHRVRESLERALQHGVGSAADRQRERSDKLEARLEKMEGQQKELKETLSGGLNVLNKLEARLDKTEGQVKEMRETLPAGLKGLRMSLDGVRKYYGVQRRLIEQRLQALEADCEVAESEAATGDERELKRPPNKGFLGRLRRHQGTPDHPGRMRAPKPSPADGEGMAGNAGR